MHLSNGIDIVENSRFKGAKIELLKRIFTDYELSLYNEDNPRSCEYLASRFAAKEAFVKALGVGFVGVRPRDIEIYKDDNGTPHFNLYNKAKELLNNRLVSLSISHEKAYSIAMVVVYE